MAVPEDDKRSLLLVRLWLNTAGTKNMAARGCTAVLPEPCSSSPIVSELCAGNVRSVRTRRGESAKHEDWRSACFELRDQRFRKPSYSLRSGVTLQREIQVEVISNRQPQLERPQGYS